MKIIQILDEQIHTSSNAIDTLGHSNDFARQIPLLLYVKC